MRSAGLRLAVLAGLIGLWHCGPLAADRPRLAILTDIGGDPDDQQSMVRLLLYANEFEIEALIASASGTRGELKKAVTRPDLILEIIDGYYGDTGPTAESSHLGWPDRSGASIVASKTGSRRQRIGRVREASESLRHQRPGWHRRLDPQRVPRSALYSFSIAARS